MQETPPRCCIQKVTQLNDFLTGNFMKFYFLAHRPKAIVWFLITLLTAVSINIFLVVLIFPWVKAIGEIVEQSIVLIIPAVVILFIPTFLAAITAYRAMVGRFCLTIEENNLIIQQVNKKDAPVNSANQFKWNEIISCKPVAFEDEQYLKISFRNARNNLLLHRDSGEWEKFLEVMRERTTPAN